MSTALPTPTAQRERVTPRIWGLSPQELHERFWASRGVQVVQRGCESSFVSSAELYLLVDPDALVVFELHELVDVLSWLAPRLLVVRLADGHHDGYREAVECDDEGRLLRFERLYDGSPSGITRVGLTSDRAVARLWQEAPSSRDGWRSLRRAIPIDDREARRMPGRVFDARQDEQLVAHLECLMDTWTLPKATIPRARRLRGIWADQEAEVARSASFVGQAWVGAGRRVEPGEIVVGPAILWDDPEAGPNSVPIPWGELEPLPQREGRGRAAVPFVRRPGKRLFDIAFSLVALALTLPLYPFIALAILIEDGWPIFFTHRRETVGGRQFPCLKFRSMRRDAEKIKAQLSVQNRSDGPQFYVKDDPRSTRVGKFLRKTQLDELPQFINVLLGHMAVVGPRPSPRAENQYCPSWRERRLSVRPGVTGLWQVSRTRKKGLDFQEWIRYDLEYVERMNLWLDLKIIWKTIGIVFRRGAR